MIITYSWLDGYQSIGVNTYLSYFASMATTREVLNLNSYITQALSLGSTIGMSLAIDSAIDLEEI